MFIVKKFYKSAFSFILNKTFTEEH